MKVSEIEQILELFIDPSFDVAQERIEGNYPEDWDDYSVVVNGFPESAGWAFWLEQAFWGEDKGTNVPRLGYVKAEYERNQNEAQLIFKIYPDSTCTDKPDIYRKNGWYSSYEGACFEEEFEKVKEVQKTITVYESWE